MMSRFSVVPASYVLFTRRSAGRDEILLQLRSHTGFMDGYWATASAGHIERNESVFDAATREAYEELGVTDLSLRPLCAMHRSQGEAPIDQRVDYFLLATGWSGKPQIQEPEKCAELRWFALDALPDPVVPHELQVIENYRRGALEPIVTHGF